MNSIGGGFISEAYELYVCVCAIEWANLCCECGWIRQKILHSLNFPKVKPRKHFPLWTYFNQKKIAFPLVYGNFAPKTLCVCVCVCANETRWHFPDVCIYSGSTKYNKVMYTSLIIHTRSHTLSLYSLYFDNYLTQKDAYVNPNDRLFIKVVTMSVTKNCSHDAKSLFASLAVPLRFPFQQ